MCTYIRTLEVPKLSQHNHTLLLQYVEPFFSTDISDQIVWRRRLMIITMAFMTTVLTFPRPTIPKPFPVSSHTQSHLLTCYR